MRILTVLTPALITIAAVAAIEARSRLRRTIWHGLCECGWSVSYRDPGRVRGAVASHRWHHPWADVLGHCTVIVDEREQRRRPQPRPVRLLGDVILEDGAR